MTHDKVFIVTKKSNSRQEALDIVEAILGDPLVSKDTLVDVEKLKWKILEIESLDIETVVDKHEGKKAAERFGSDEFDIIETISDRSVLRYNARKSHE